MEQSAPHASDFVRLDMQAMTAGFEASSRQMKADSKHGKQGSMVTLALVCGHHLTVATAGTSMAHLDIGSDILLVSIALMHASCPCRCVSSCWGIVMVVQATVRVGLCVYVCACVRARVPPTIAHQGQHAMMQLLVAFPDLCVWAVLGSHQRVNTFNATACISVFGFALPNLSMHKKLWPFDFSWVCSN